MRITAAFLLGRYLARDWWVSGKVNRYPAFAALDRAVADQGWKIVGLTRLSPVFSFTLLNDAFGLTGVRLRDCMLASWVGMMPGTVMSVYVGSLARVGVTTEEPSAPRQALYALGLIATMAVTILITGMARQTLASRLQSGPGEGGPDAA